jgi:hypothetical protein
MKRNSRRLSGWIVLVVIALAVGMIGASERLPPKGPLAFLYAQIHALFVEADDLAAESDNQQEQIDQLTSTLCGLSVLTDNPTPPEFCEGIVTAVCGCEQDLIDCLCEPGDFFELESCESGSFPHPDFGEQPPPKCWVVEGCRGTFTRIAAGDAANIEVEAECEGTNPGGSGGDRCPECDHGCDEEGVCRSGCLIDKTEC